MVSDRVLWDLQMLACLAMTLQPTGNAMMPDMVSCGHDLREMCLRDSMRLLEVQTRLLP